MQNAFRGQFVGGGTLTAYAAAVGGWRGKGMGSWASEDPPPKRWTSVTTIASRSTMSLFHNPQRRDEFNDVAAGEVTNNKFDCYQVVY